MTPRSSFQSAYEKNCALYNTFPLGGVLHRLSEGYLDIDADKISASDWYPLIDTIGDDFSLKFMAVRSYYRFENDRQRLSHLHPAIFERNLTHRLCSGLASSISKCKALHCFIIQGFPLEKRDIAILTQGLSENNSIRQLSFENCTIYDEGILKLVPVLRDKIDMYWLNVTNCGITDKGAFRLCDLIQSQSILRHSAVWADSLRCRQPCYGRMPGIRRLTMCNNFIGDCAGSVLAEKLRDDRWLKALDLQNCNLSNSTAKAFIKLLKVNNCLAIVDLRKNKGIDAQLLNVLKKKLHCDKGAWQWLGSNSEGDNEAGDNIPMREFVLKSKNHFSVKAYTCSRKSCTEKPKRSRRRARSLSMHGRITDLTTSSLEEDPFNRRSPLLSGRCYSPTNNMPTRVFNGSRPGQISQLNMMLSREVEARRRVEDRLKILELENSRLLSEVTSLRRSVTPVASLLPDEALEQVEQTIAQFHDFLDYLKEKGLGDVVRQALSPQSELIDDQGSTNTQTQATNK